MGLFDFFKADKPIREPLTLVASVGAQFASLMEEDKGAYVRCSKTVDVMTFDSMAALLEAVRRGYQILHLFIEVSADGTLAGSKLSGTDLITAAADNGTKLLVVANANDPNGYIQGFNAQGKGLNLVMTIDRRGSVFATFLRSLMSEMQGGLSMPRAWVRLAPQIADQDQPHAPVTIFFAGLGQERFV